MIKEPILKYKTKKALNKPNKKQSTTFESAKSIGFLFDNNDNYKKTKSFIEKLTNEGKSTIILIRSKEKEAPTSKHYVHKDFNWSGSVSSERVSNFIKTKFDYLFMLNDEIHYLNQYILASSEAKCRVGLNKEEFQPFFELMFENSNKESIDKFYNTVKSYLDKIKS